MAAWRATIDFSLPTKRGVTTDGKITTSLRGKSGIFFVFFPDIFYKFNLYTYFGMFL
jgi:hypothetical protein